MWFTWELGGPPLSPQKYKETNGKATRKWMGEQAEERWLGGEEGGKTAVTVKLEIERTLFIFPHVQQFHFQGFKVWIVVLFHSYSWIYLSVFLGPLWMRLLPFSFSVYSSLIYRKTNNFFASVFHHATFWKVFISSRSFLLVSLGSIMYLLLAVYKQWYFELSPSCNPFVLFSSLIAWVNTSTSLLNRSGQNGHFCLILVIYEAFQIFLEFAWY